MNFIRVILFGLALALAAACGGPGRGGPDGGTNRQVCVEGISTLAVTVRDSNGAPVKGATVSARHLGTNTTITSETNDQGVANAITSDTGSGSVQVRATLGTRTSNLAQVEWACGECACIATPAQTVLVLP